MKDKTPYLVLFIGIVSILVIFISTFNRAYAFYTAFYTTNRWSVVARQGMVILDTRANKNANLQSIVGEAYSNWDYDPEEHDGYILIDVVTPYDEDGGTTYGDAFSSGDNYLLISSPSSTGNVYLWAGTSGSATMLVPSQKVYLNPDSSHYFEGQGNMVKIGAIDGSKMDTSLVTNMSNMFLGAINLSVLNTNGWDTRNVEYMDNMFSYANINNYIANNISTFNTYNVTNMAFMFYMAADYGNYGQKTSVLNLSSWNTNKVTNMAYMFRSAILKKVIMPSNVGALNNVTYLTGGIDELVMTNWNAKSLTNATYMIDSSVRILNMYGSNFSVLTNATNMISGATSLNTITTPGFIKSGTEILLPRNFIDTQTLIIYNRLNSTTPKNKTLNAAVAEFARGDVVQNAILDMQGRISAQYFQNFKYCNVASECGGLANIQTNGIIVSSSTSPMPIYVYANQSLSHNTIYYYTLVDSSGIYLNTNAVDMFRGFIYLQNITGIQSWNTYKTKNVSNMFRNTGKLLPLNLYSWNLYNVTTQVNMNFMFQNANIRNIVSPAMFYRPSSGSINMVLPRGYRTATNSTWVFNLNYSTPVKTLYYY